VKNKFTPILAIGLSIFAALPEAQSQSATLDYGLTTGEFYNEGVMVSDGDGLFELGYFTDYTDGAGVGYFSGKDYSTLRSSFSLLPSSATPVQIDGQFYQTVDLLTTPGGTRLFAWVFNTTAASTTANWSIISGVIGGTEASDISWVAVAPGDPTYNFIELGTMNNLIYAKSNPGNSLLANSTYSPDGADVSVVPEPQISYLLFAGAGLILWRVRARWRKAA